MKTSPEKRVSLRYPAWDQFFDRSVARIFESGGLVVDIGGGLRISKGKESFCDPHRYKKYAHHLQSSSVDFKVTDYTDKYHPDLVEDIHQLSFADSSIDGIFCLAVLEHVHDPKKAAEEIVRVLKKGGQALIYVPFLYRYHAHVTDYSDYFRYSKDGIKYLFRECSSVEMCYVRGFFETLLRFTPLHTLRPFMYLARMMDHSCARMRDLSAQQTSGYNIFITK